MMRLKESYEFLDKAADQHTLFKFLNQSGTDSPRVLVLDALPASGISYFLKHAQKLCARNRVAVYGDLQSDNLNTFVDNYIALSSKFFMQRVCVFFGFRKAIPLLIKVLGLVIPLPYFRAASVSAGALVRGIFDTPYKSLPLQRFSEHVRCPISKKEVVFLIDNAQADFSKIDPLLKTVFSPEYSHVKFVIAHVHRSCNDDTFLKLQVLIQSSGLHFIIKKFLSPNTETILAFAAHHEIEMEQNESNKIVQQTNADIWKIRYYFSHDIKSDRLDNDSIYILRLLRVAKQPLHLSDLRIIGNESPLTLARGHVIWDDIIQALASRNFIYKTDIGGDALISLNIMSHPSLNFSEIDEIVASKELYEYFLEIGRHGSLRHAAAPVHALLYRLSSVVATDDRREWARALVKAELAQGALSDAERFIETARIGPVANSDDLMVLVCFYASVQAYERVLGLLNGTRGLWSGNRLMEIMYAVSLNRTRQHNDSIKIIDTMLEATSNKDEIALLISYKIAGLLHEGHFELAATTANNAPKKIERSTGYGYYLRNAAAAFMWGQTKDFERADAMLNQATLWFRRRGDRFGELTCQCNIGVILCYKEKIEKACCIFEGVYRSIRVYGTQHIEEVATNLGLSLLLIGRHKEAYEHLRRIIPVIPWDYPKCIASCSLAFLEAIQGEIETARQIMFEATINARDLGLIEIQERCENNKILIDTIIGHDLGRTYGAAQNNRNIYGDRQSDHKIENTCIDKNVYDSYIKSFDYDFCQYWSQNPLAMIPGS